MPFVVTEAKVESIGAAGFLELVSRNCPLKKYKKINPIKSFDVAGEFIAYASPDSTYAVTRRLLDSAKKEIIIGIYDFSASYMKDILLNAMQRDVKVSLMLDIDGTTEEKIFKELAKFGGTTVPAPSCASKKVSYFPSSHEKVIVIDDTWTLVQSGNYSRNSIPFNEVDGGDPDSFVTGNRDMGVAIRSAPLAKFFAKLLRSDMRLELTGPEKLGRRQQQRPEPDLVEAMPKKIPEQLFASKRFNPDDAVSVTPVLTPDNYMNVIPDFLESATQSIFIEQQYIRGSQTDIVKLLTRINAARDKNAALDVRIILGKPFDQEDYEKEQANIKRLRESFGLKLGEHIRFIDIDRFVHCHNKLIIVDEEAVVISSQNWSRTGVGTNREAGVLMRYPDIARYYAEIFESDWKTALKRIPKPPVKEAISPEALAKGNFVEVRAADYQEV
ncbi:MAG TPA: phospholipase D-like domain-containing protein [Thermoanaerobaculia bacterium]|jgi:phosphatidylserine/phosphatidylglycerophosphate/cardiolipin synthase-like enzyme|nr:phospholipase D-like domain-containing protein [Thermoanaerobaculia bacterium]